MPIWRHTQPTFLIGSGQALIPLSVYPPLDSCSHCSLFSSRETTGTVPLGLEVCHTLAMWLSSRRPPYGSHLHPGKCPMVRRLSSFSLSCKNSRNCQGDIISASLLGTKVLALNSQTVIGDLLDKQGHVYSDRPVLTVLGELMGLNRARPNCLCPSYVLLISRSPIELCHDAV